MPRRRLTVDQITALKLRLQRGAKTQADLGKEFKVSVKTVGKYKKMLLAETQPLKLEKYKTDSVLQQLQVSNRALHELVRQLADENLQLRQKVIHNKISGDESERVQY